MAEVELFRQVPDRQLADAEQVENASPVWRSYRPEHIAPVRCPTSRHRVVLHVRRRPYVRKVTRLEKCCMQFPEAPGMSAMPSFPELPDSCVSGRWKATYSRLARSPGRWRLNTPRVQVVKLLIFGDRGWEPEVGNEGGVEGGDLNDLLMLDAKDIDLERLIG